MGTKKAIWAMLLMVAVLAAACSPAGAPVGPEAGAAPQGGVQGGPQTMIGEAGLQGDATPQPDEFVEGRVVDSTGQEYSSPQSSAPSAGGAPGVSPSGFPGQSEAAEEPFTVVSTYNDPQFGFSVGMPANIVVVEGKAQVLPVPLAQVYFMDEALANSELADMEPPQLAIRVYDNAAGKTVEQWLNDEGILTARFGGQRATVEPYAIGDLQGVRVTSMLMLAPNSAVFLADEGVIYELQPLGLVGEQMMATFQLQAR